MIVTKGLRKSYRPRRGTAVDAVRGIDLTVEEGEIYGLLGPNGAGKTTTLRMLATLLVPDGGAASIAGADLRAEPGEVRRRIGYVAQGGGTTDQATAREELVLQARMYGIRKADAVQRAEQGLAAFDLAEFGDRPCKTYSGGQRRRLDLALGVVHRPKVLFLDEPTVGLDPRSRAQVWAEVRRLREQGMTVLLTTHYLDEADALCDRIGIVDHGGIVNEGTPEQLKQEISGDAVTIGLPGAEDAARAERALAELPCVQRLEALSDGDGLRLHVDSAATAIPQLLRTLAAAGIEPEHVQLQRPSLDDVFLALTGRPLVHS